MLHRQRSDGLQIRTGQHATGRIGGAVDDQELRSRRDQRSQLVDVEPKVMLPPESAAGARAPTKSIMLR